MQNATPVPAPFPERRRGPKSPYTVKLLALSVGDTFRAKLAHRAKVSVLVGRWGKRLGRKFRTTRVGEKTLLVGRVA